VSNSTVFHSFEQKYSLMTALRQNLGILPVYKRGRQPIYKRSCHEAQKNSERPVLNREASRR